MPTFSDYASSLLEMPNQQEEKEKSLIRKLAAASMTPLQYVGETFDKFGQGLRGALALKPLELLNWIPFSDALGITSSEGLLGGTPLQLTDDEDAVSGRQLLETWGMRPNQETGISGWWDDPGEGIRDLAGFTVDVFLDPLTFVTLGGSAITKAAKAMKAAGLLNDPATIAKLAGKSIKGQATARHALTPNDALQQALRHDPDAETKFLRSIFKGNTANKTMANLPTDIAAQMNKPIGGIANIEIPFLQDPLYTWDAPKLAEWLDKSTGKIRYGTQLARGLNALFSAPHTKGQRGESRVLQETVIPTLKHHENILREQLNPRIAALKGQLQRHQDQIAADYAGLETDPRYQTTLLLEGILPNNQWLRKIAGQTAQQNPGTLSAASNAIRQEHQLLEDFLQQTARKADIPVSDLYDLFVEHAYRRRIPELSSEVSESTDSIKDLLSKRDPALKNIEGGTTQIDKAYRYLAQQLGNAQGAASAGQSYTVSNKVLRNYLKNNLDIPKVALTEEGMQRLQQVQNELAAGRLTKARAIQLVQEIKKKDGIDRLKYLIETAKQYSPDKLAKGFYMDPVSSLETAANATVNSVARSRAFHDLLQQPNVINAYQQAGSSFIPIKDAYKRLGLDPNAINAAGPGKLNANQMVPEQLIKDLLPIAKGTPSEPGILQSLLDYAKSFTQLNKAFMTGAITNPSFSARNRVSGAATNAYTGTTGPLEALKEFGQGMLSPLATLLSLGKSTRFLTPGKLAARGLDIPDLSKNELILDLARQHGRNITSDADATNFLRELYAAYGGGHQAIHSADNLVENMQGIGQFLGGQLGPTGEDAFSWRKVLKDALKTKDQLLGREGGIKELLSGAAGSSLFNDGIRRPKPTSALLASGDRVNHYVEAQNRFNPWLHQILQGVDPAEAMRRVNRAQVDYRHSNYTPFENEVIAPLLFPFYKFSKNSAIAHANELLNKPGGALSHLLQLTAGVNERDELLPEWIKEKTAIPVDILPFGLNKLLGSEDPNSKRYITSLGLAYEDPLTWLSGSQGGLPLSPKNTLFELLGRLNPILKGLGEVATGQSFFQQDETGRGRLITDQDPPLGRLLTNIAQLMGKDIKPNKSRETAKNVSAWLGGPYTEAIVANSPLSRFITSLKNATDTRPNSFPKFLANYLTGLRIYELDDKQKESLLRGLINQAITAMPYARTRTSAYIPEEHRASLEQKDIEMLENFRALERMLRRHKKQREANALATRPILYDPLELQFP